MYDLETIVARNKEAERLGLARPGAVGTSTYREPQQSPPGEWAVDGQVVKGHRDDQGGLRGHSIGDDYPFSAVGGIDSTGTTWTVQNLLTGQTFETFTGPDACARAHTRCAELKASGGE